MSKAKVLLASLIWLFLLTIGVLLYRLWWKPAEVAEQQRKDQAVVEATSGQSTYQHTVRLGLDAFSGYAILRSPELSQQLRALGTKLETVDDGADYGKRLASLADGRLQMAAFPIDALLAASAERKSLPATIVSLLDETRGADAVLGYRGRFPDIDALNSPDTRFVLVGGSPSETLFRVLLHDFRLDKLSRQSLVPVTSAQEVFQRYRAAKPTGPEVFITWEPYVSQMKSNDAIGVLLDTSRQSGYIVDALVVSRDFLIKNPAVVRQVLEAYFRVLYSYAEPERLVDLVARDAEATGSPVTRLQAKELVNGIQWKNTQENLAHFGLVSAPVPHLEDLIDRIKRVLLETQGLSQDPTGGESSKLFNERALRELSESGFHPGLSPEEIRAGNPLANLSDSQWEHLVSVGTISAPPLVFARGRASLTEASQAALDELVDKLNSWPNYYVKVVGNAGSFGDKDANQQLASARAQAALDYLLSKGVSAARIRAVAGQANGEMSVNFVFGQLPY